MNEALQKLRVGWIGVGAMGLPMCAHLAQGGVPVTAFDRSRARLELAAGRGLHIADAMAQATQDADVVFSMVFDDAALESVISSPTGVASTLAAGALFIDMSTVSPGASARVAHQLAQRGIRYLRAPVSGSVPLAEAATLTVLASGDRADFDAAQPLLALLSQAQQYVGPGEVARAIKLAINLMVANSTALMGEALALGEQLDVPRDVMVDALNASIVGSRHYAARAASLKSRDYNTNGSVDLVTKDLDLALSLARHHCLNLEITERVRKYLSELHDTGLGGTEVTVLAEHAARKANRSELK